MATNNTQPRELVVLDYVKERAHDIAELLDAVDNADLPFKEVTHGPRTCLQHLPRHMRRRAMSHNVKRFPLFQRRFAENTVLSKHRKKPPSRYWRRRATNLLKAYQRRQRKSAWLETHIWHAKRFRMVDKWGYKVAERSCARSFRATYRDSRQHCSIHDMSYCTPIQVTGNRDHLIKCLNRLCSHKIGLTFKYEYAFDGSTEQSIILYKADQYPLGCIGPVRYMWRCTYNIDDCALWVWLHPSNIDHVIEQFVHVMNLVKVHHNDSKDDSSNAFTTMYKNGNNISMNVIKEQFCRFRLSGRHSTAVLQSVLRAHSSQSDIFKADIGKRSWWSNLDVDTVKGELDQQATQLSSLTHPTSMPNGQIINVYGRDPRIVRPANKRKPTEMKPLLNDHDWMPSSNTSSASHLWDYNVRNTLTNERLSDADLIKERRTKREYECDTILPIVLVVNNSSNNGLSCGIDLILPSAWGKCLWIAFQYATARACGLRDIKHMALEGGGPCFPYDIPDCDSGRTEAKLMGDTLRAKWLRKPSNRRVDYAKQKVPYPFMFDWPTLVGNDDYYVLRDRRLLLELEKWWKRKTVQLSDELTKQTDQALIPVLLTPTLHVTPKHLAMICVPRANSKPKCKELTPEPKTAVPQSLESFVSIPSAEKELKFDDLLPDKTTSRQEYRTVKKRQKRRRIKDNKKRKLTTNTSPPQTLHKSPKTHMLIPDHEIIGGLLRGDYSFTRGQPIGIGYVALKHLIKLRQNSNVLFRNTSSIHFHEAKLVILTCDDCRW